MHLKENVRKKKKNDLFDALKNRIVPELCRDCLISLVFAYEQDFRRLLAYPRFHVVAGKAGESSGRWWSRKRWSYPSPSLWMRRWWSRLAAHQLSVFIVSAPHSPLASTPLSAAVGAWPSCHLYPRASSLVYFPALIATALSPSSPSPVSLHVRGVKLPVPSHYISTQVFHVFCMIFDLGATGTSTVVCPDVVQGLKFRMEENLT